MTSVNYDPRKKRHKLSHLVGNHNHNTAGLAPTCCLLHLMIRVRYILICKTNHYEFNTNLQANFSVTPDSKDDAHFKYLNRTNKTYALFGKSIILTYAHYSQVLLGIDSNYLYVFRDS